MSRVLFGVMGVVMSLFPTQVLDGYERLALRNPEACTARPGLVSGIRAEGLVYVAISAAGGRPYEWLLKLAGAVGVVVALFPRPYLDFGADLGYEDPEAVEWNDGFVTAVRALGVLLVLLAIRSAADGSD